MNWTDEALMAFVDAELDAAQRADLEHAMAGDPALQARVAALQAQRRRVRAAFAPVLDEPLPERLAAALADAAPSAAVAQLDAARAARAQRRAVPIWVQWGGMAASVMLGAVLGLQLAGRGGDGAPLEMREGRLVASGSVERALSTQRAGASRLPVAVQLSFVDHAGAYCRTFSTAAVAGLACRRDGQWAVQTLAATEGVNEGAMRQAASALPRAVLDSVDQRIAGAALDAEREREALERGWQR